ncbi:sensor histidine kinase [Rasiella sp. SM2506]|uniref:sensor histidine kinase n=1 Tax=Rasiella sp. SM2506 TaxID=3423914 RepID=UPI003D79DACA
MDQREEIVALISVVILLVLVAIIITLITVFVRRKNKFLLEQQITKEAYERELSEIQIEIREETLRNISWELHDNIGQLMTLAKIQVQLTKEKPETIDEASKTIGKAISEIRMLSKLINPEAIKNLSLPEAVRLEMERFNRMDFIKATYHIIGSSFSIGSDKEIIVFRILQEFFSNTIKHSKATTLDVSLTYTENELLINAQDNGIGFQDEIDYSGIGIKNMTNRAKVIGADFKISSMPNEGTALRLLYT